MKEHCRRPPTNQVAQVKSFGGHVTIVDFKHELQSAKKELLKKLIFTSPLIARARGMTNSYANVQFTNSME